MDPSELVEQLRMAILDKMEAIRQLRTKLRVECVPSSVCTYLAQCLKDTDVSLLCCTLKIILLEILFVLEFVITRVVLDEREHLFQMKNGQFYVNATIMSV